MWATAFNILVVLVVYAPAFVSHHHMAYMASPILCEVCDLQHMYLVCI